MKKTYLLVIILIVLVILTICLTTLNKENTATGTSSNKIYESSNLFTERDLEQEVDTSKATSYTISNGNDITITKEGVYLISGTAQNTTIYVEAGDEDKVQLILDGLSITNETMPAIYVKTANKVFVTLKETNTLKVIGTFTTDGTTKLNGAIFSKQDIVLNGTGSLTIDSTKSGIVGKDDIKITGGTYNIKAKEVAIKANDSIRIANGNITLNAGTDGLHAENSDDDTKGYIYINGGNINIQALDDCVHGQSVVQVDDGTLILNGDECIEGTYIQINGGNINIKATSDGINAGSKSESYDVTIEITGGTISVETTSDECDAIDSNGDIKITGGTIKVNSTLPFDYVGNVTFTGGTVIVNGTQVDTIPKSTK